MMNKCINCEKKLSFFNKPIFRYGKLKDGTELCHSCFKEINKIDMTLTTKLKNYDLAKLKEMTKKSKQEKKENKKIIIEHNYSQNTVELSNRENQALHKELGKSESILSMYRCGFSDDYGVLILTEFRLILIIDGVFSINGINIYYYNQISRLKIEDKSFKFKDLHNGYEGEKETFTGFKSSQLDNCVALLKEQIKIHKKYNKDSYPYLISDYEQRKISRDEFLTSLEDYK